MDSVKKRGKKGVSLSVYIGRHIGVAIYLLCAEMRFKAFCVALFYKKRPYLARTYSGTILSIEMMIALAVAATVVA